MPHTKLPATGERFTLEMDGMISLEHWHRYHLAYQFSADKFVLDLASGEGYGSSLLAQTARQVIGVDISEEAIAWAKATYRRDNLEYKTGSATSIPLENESVDLIVSFETIEHLKDHDGMLAEFRRVLKKGGQLLISSPNKKIYSDRDGYKNSFHQRELYTPEFLELVQAHFKRTVLMGQKTTGASIIASADVAAPFLTFLDDIVCKGISEQRYDLIFASDHELPTLPNSIYEDLRGPLQAEKTEQKIFNLQSQATIAMNEVHRLKDENVTLRNYLDALKSGNPSPAEEDFTQDVQILRRQVDLRTYIQFRLLRALSSKHFPLPSRMKARFRRSSDKRLRRLINSAGGSKAMAPPAYVSSFSARTEPKLTVIAMARNEAARAHDSLRHFCALFDKVVLIDHRSNDQTAQIAARYNGVNNTEVVVLRGEDAGYYQSEYMSAVANALIAEGRSDWIFFLDLDEYLPFQTTGDLRQALVDLGDHSVIHMHWCNLALTSFDVETFQGANVIMTPTVSAFVKVALNTRCLPVGKVEVCQGNHAVILPNYYVPVVGERAFGLFHVPIAGLDALRRKVDQGSRALEETRGKVATLGDHWVEMSAQIDSLTTNADLVREVALNYGRPLKEIIASVSNGNLTADTRPLTLRFAQTEKADETDQMAALESFTLDTIDKVVAQQFKRIPADSDTLAALGQALYCSLPLRSSPVPELRTGRDRIEHALLSAVTDIEVTVPTAWMGHIPFLFTLMETMRPRRYVELGTHAGFSFFAACQHIRSNGNYGEGVAIDLWTGDYQAGMYDESVFATFKLLLNRHFPKSGKYIRGNFSDAVASFEDKSIDLLHIDGLHTYAAVKEDYETWLPKLAENGVVIFHDTNEFQTDFGVWQLFEEVRGSAAVSFQFRHSHGLGVMAFGSPESNPAIELVEHLHKNASKMESYFSVLGKALYDAARFRRP